MHIREVLWVPMIHTHEADIIRILSNTVDRGIGKVTSCNQSGLMTAIVFYGIDEVYRDLLVPRRYRCRVVVFSVFECLLSK
jgi:hypothetical protein